MTSPLAGLRVVEIGGRIASAYCGKLLRDAGADVAFAEPDGGSPLRRSGAFFDYLAGGKRSVTAGPAELTRLAERADIVILAGSPAQARKSGIDCAAIRSAAPGVALVTISDFGWNGPWAEYPANEFTLQAWCGSTGSRGGPERPPIAAGGDLGEFIAGGYAAFLAVAAHRGGTGALLDLSVLEAMAQSMQTFGWLRGEVSGLSHYSRSTEVPSIERAKDGYVGVSMATAAQWKGFCAMVGRPDLAAEPALAQQLNRWRERDRIRAAVGPWLAAHTVAEIVEQAEAHRVPMAAIGTGATLAEMDHFVARGVYRPNPAGFRQPRPPWLISGAEPQPIAPAPAPGRDDPARLWPEAEPRSAPPQSADFRPLTGLRVVDLTAFWAGPAATQLLAMLGADVIKVESCRHPDGMRFSGGLRTDVSDWWEYSWVFHAVNSNKRSVTLDLQSARGRELFGRLVGGADLVVENFPARVLEQLGLDYDTLRGVNEGLVVVRMPGFGLDGPWRNRGGFAMTMEQLAGLAWITGYPDDVPTAPRGPCDALAAVHGAFAALCGLEMRRRTGGGRLVEVPMIEAVLNATAGQVIAYDVTGVAPNRNGNRGHDVVLQNVYRCPGDEQWIAISVRDGADLAALASVVGRPESAIDDDSLASWCAGRPREESVRALLDAGVPAAPVVLPTDIGDNPQLAARRFLETLEHPRVGPVRYQRPPIAAGPEGFLTRPAPTLGQHNREVLCGLLGLTGEQLAQLERDGVIGTEPLR